MKNPLLRFHNWLFNSDSTKHSAVISIEDRIDSIYDEDITSEIKSEVGLVFMRIDEEFWKNSKSENEYFLAKFLTVLDKLIGESIVLLEAQLVQLAKRCDIDNWLVVYNNIQCVYENLLGIQRHVVGYYCDGLQGEKRFYELKYPVFFKEWAEQLQRDCHSNLGQSNTLFECYDIKGNAYTIEVATRDMSRQWLDVKIDSISCKNKDNIKVVGGLPVDSTNKEEKIDLDCSVETLGLLFKLLLSSEFVLSKNKTMVSRVLAESFTLKSGAFKPDSVYRSFTTREFDHKNIPIVTELLVDLKRELLNEKKNQK